MAKVLFERPQDEVLPQPRHLPDGEAGLDSGFRRNDGVAGMTREGT
jgi:hypothetical protein